MDLGSERDLTDAQLVERVRRGDADAFESLVRRHYRAAYSVALGGRPEITSGSRGSCAPSPAPQPAS